MTTITAKDMELVDLALWRSGRREPGAIEAAFDHNPGLAARPPQLEARVPITLPPAQRSVAAVKTVKLWD